MTARSAGWPRALRARGPVARAVAVVALAAPAVLGTGPLLAPGAPPAHAASGPDYCTDGDGVTVVVDLRRLDPDAPVVVRCAEDVAGEDGFAALAAAGLRFVMPARFPGMVCRLSTSTGVRPTASEQIRVRGDRDYAEQCVNTPPTDAYWSYWHADEGGTWRYSSSGAGNRDVAAGGFEGWSFSLNQGGSPSPPRVRPRNPNAPYEEESDGPAGGGNGGGQGAGGQAGAPSAPTTEPPTTEPPTTEPPTTEPPTTEPPTTEPPTTEPSPTEPSPTEPPTTEPTGTTPGPGPGSAGGNGPGPAGARDDRARRGPGPGDRDGRADAGDAGAGRNGDVDDGADGARSTRTRAAGVTLTGDVPAEASADESGPPLSTLLGGGLLAALALTVAAVAWRRRTAGTS